MRRLCQKIWWLAWLHDFVFAVGLIVGGPIAVVDGLIMGDPLIAGLGALAFVAGVGLTIYELRTTQRAPSGHVDERR